LDIEDYIKDGVTIDDEELDTIIDEIVEWIELEVQLTRGEVIEELDSFGLDPERVLPGESAGLADKIKYTYLSQAGWNISDSLYVTIGQGQSAYTPIQMANMVATMTNGGYRHNLTLIDSIKNYDNSETVYEYTPDSERIELSDYEDLEHVKMGMKRV